MKLKYLILWKEAEAYDGEHYTATKVAVRDLTDKELELFLKDKDSIVSVTFLCIPNN